MLTRDFIPMHRKVEVYVASAERDSAYSVLIESIDQLGVVADFPQGNRVFWPWASIDSIAWREAETR